MTENELQLKAQYLKCPEFQLGQPFYQPSLAALCSQIGISPEQFSSLPLQENLTEDDCVPIKSDAAVLRHDRYLPALYHAHPVFEMIYVWIGSCTHYVNDAALPMQTGDLCLIAPMTCHTVSVNSDDTVVYHFFLRCSSFERVFLDLSAGRDILSDFFVQALYAVNRNNVLPFPTGTDEILRSFIKFACQESAEQTKYSS